MKKFILPLLLLLAIGMLAAVESAPSAVVGYVKYPIVTGLNVIALPMAETYAMASDIGAAYPGMFDTFNAWDNTTQTWVAAADLGGFWDNDYAVTNGMALWPNAISGGSFYSIGALPTAHPAYTLVTGLNMIMIPLNKASLTMAGELGLDVGTLDTVNSWDNVTQSWVAAADLGGFWDNDFAVAIGGGYWVNSLSSTTWPTRSNSINLRNSK